MSLLSDIGKMFELKKDLGQFLNSPLFILIVVVTVAVFVVIFVVKRRRRRKREAIEEPEEEIEEEAIEKPCESMATEKQTMKEQPIYEKLGTDECLIVSKGKNGVVTIISNKNGIPKVEKLSTTGKDIEQEEETLISFWDTHGKPERKEIIKIMATEMKLDPDVFVHEWNWDKLPKSQQALLMKYDELIRKEYKELQDHDLTTQRRKPDYIPYIPESEQESPETERAIPLEKPRDTEMVKKVLRYSPDDVGDVEQKIDKLLVKKKRNF